MSVNYWIYQPVNYWIYQPVKRHGECKLAITEKIRFGQLVHLRIIGTGFQNVICFETLYKTWVYFQIGRIIIYKCLLMGSMFGFINQIKAYRPRMEAGGSVYSLSGWYIQYLTGNKKCKNSLNIPNGLLEAVNMRTIH
jgi:hypothetical protein